MPLVGGRDLVLTLPRQWRAPPAGAAALRGAADRAGRARADRSARMIVGGQGVPQLEVPLMAGADVERLGIVPRIPAVVSRLVFGS